jgi:hypothetical protein
MTSTNISRNTDGFCKSNIKEVRRKKKESGQAAGLLAKTSSSSATPPGISPTAKLDKTISCGEVRKGILSDRPEIQNDTINYMRLSLLAPKADDNDGSIYTRMAINMDVSFNNNTRFDKFKWRLTNKRSEFYPNLPSSWETDFAYGSAWELYNELVTNKWIGKACYRMTKKTGSQKLKMAPLTAIVLWGVGEVLHYRLWIENAEVQGQFIYKDVSKFIAYSEPIHNFTASEMQVIQL